MKTKFITAIIFSLLIVNQGCELNNIEFSKITPENFYKTEKDAKLAVASLYSSSLTGGFFNQDPYSSAIVVADESTDILTCVYNSTFEQLRSHNFTQTLPYNTSGLFTYYRQISAARGVAKQIKAMTIPETTKNSYIAEANAIAGWKAEILYEWYGPVPYPTDEMLTKPSELVYATRPSNEDFVKIIEDLFSTKDDLIDADFGSNFGRINKGTANMILLKLYMLEAARTGDVNFWRKAQTCAEAIISSGRYKLLNKYSDIFAVSGKRNLEIIHAVPSDYTFASNIWHAQALPNNYPCNLNRGAGAWGGLKMPWAYYDTFDQKMDQRCSNALISASYTTDKGLVIDRAHPYDFRHGLGSGAIPVKYAPDPSGVGSAQIQDFIVYRYADVLLSMAEILNELGVNANVTAPVMTQVANDGNTYQSDGGKTAFSFINSIRVRAGLVPLSALSKNQLRDSILMERGHELYCEGQRRNDLIRYQRVTNSGGYKIYDVDKNKFLFPIPDSYMLEYKGNILQNPGY